MNRKLTQLLWQCECGSVTADVPVKGNRIVCYCESCREFVERLDKGGRLNVAGGSELLQVAPDQVTLRGTEHLRWMRLTEKGPLRWYASCCDTPMANTLASAKFPFASFQVNELEPKSALPPVRAHVNLKGAKAQVSAPKGSILPLMLSLLANVAKARITGRWRNNPFFDDNDKPIAAQQELT